MPASPRDPRVAFSGASSIDDQLLLSRRAQLLEAGAFLRENSQEARANGRGTTLLYMHISLFQLSDF
jgi:hypothetical protein